MELNEMLAEIQAILDEDDDTAVLPETDDAPIRGVSTLHARPESLDARDWEVLQSRIRVRSENNILFINDTEYTFAFNSNNINGQWIPVTQDGIPSCVFHGHNGNRFERQFALTPDGPWFSRPFGDVHYFRDRQLPHGTWYRIAPLSAHVKSFICEELRRNA